MRLQLVGKAGRHPASPFTGIRATQVSCRFGQRGDLKQCFTIFDKVLQDTMPLTR